jgi:hypothetical protein
VADGFGGACQRGDDHQVPLGGAGLWRSHNRCPGPVSLLFLAPPTGGDVQVVLAGVAERATQVAGAIIAQPAEVTFWVDAQFPGPVVVPGPMPHYVLVAGGGTGSIRCGLWPPNRPGEICGCGRSYWSSLHLQLLGYLLLTRIQVRLSGVSPSTAAPLQSSGSIGHNGSMPIMGT